MPKHATIHTETLKRLFLIFSRTRNEPYSRWIPINKFIVTDQEDTKQTLIGINSVQIKKKKKEALVPRQMETGKDSVCDSRVHVLWNKWWKMEGKMPT